MARDPRRKGTPRRPSRQFRDAMRAVAYEDVMKVWPKVDWNAIGAITTGKAVVYDITDGEPKPFVLLHPSISDQMEFDRKVCEAGLTKFIRDTMPEDDGVGCTPLNPKTGEPDPSIVRPEINLGPHLFIEQLAPGLRSKRPYSVGTSASA